jgi:hypothetical protein
MRQGSRLKAQFVICKANLATKTRMFVRINRDNETAQFQVRPLRPCAKLLTLAFILSGAEQTACD